MPVLSIPSGKTDEKKKNVEGINKAAQKTSLSLKVASVRSVVWRIKKMKNTHAENVCAKTQNRRLMVFVGFLKSTNTPSPACNSDIKINVTWLANITYILNGISLLSELHVSHPHYGYLSALCPWSSA